MEGGRGITLIGVKLDALIIPAVGDGVICILPYLRPALLQKTN